ncbi:tRNA1(Val) (adenine(37)-N6)-methyltransferase [Mariniphaga sp.]|uniref:tRNA1(Val) (adenine(37)-N6)-methyltransferase n=1 Tax=Mariniphaga sp. TaxID=1954475 RepID=UPI0035697B81
MGRNNWFQFKQFKVIQEQTAMKVGTDGVLLGSWVDVSEAETILDIGAGTGIISIMLAQRSKINTKITGIEIENNAADEASLNATNSPWSEKITILNKSLQQFQQHCTEKFDLIVSNPPFFSNSQKSKCEYLAMAKHNHLLPLTELVEKSVKLMSSVGKLAVILPVNEAKKIIQLAKKEGLYLLRETEVRPNGLKPPHRYLLEFGKNPGTAEKEILLIHSSESNSYTEKYKFLTRDFYLNF